MDSEDRRAAGVKRVPIERVVEICGRDERVPAFEAESVELSGRGMLVRTPYLPELGAPIVCRLEDQGREVVVEGLVAWRQDTEDGGKFGIKFTALDSGSVETLRDLCGMGEPAEPEKPARESSREAAPPEAPAGAAVKLHIEGLGAPMKARVRRSSRRRLHVGSNLEFLRVGRSLEVEDLDRHERRGALIDAVDVAIDPQTQVPQLVVTLRYPGIEDVTPEPSVVDASEGAAHGSFAGAALRAGCPTDAHPTMESAAVPAPDDDVQSVRRPGLLDETIGVDASEHADEEVDEEPNPFPRRLENAASAAQRMASRAGSVMTRVGATAAVGLGAMARRAGAGLRDLHARRTARPRRTTAAPPSSMMSSEGRRLRPQSMRQALPVPTQRRATKAIVAGAGIALVAGAAYAWFSGDDSAAQATAAASAAAPVAVAPAGELAPVAAAPAPMQPPAAAKAAPAERPAAAVQKSEKGIIADVPLFGPTAMATLEPAPLGPPPGAEDAEPESEFDNGAQVADESFDDGAAAEKAAAARSEDVGADGPRPEDVKPWGHGRLHLPVIHRMKLDGAAGGLQGQKRATGFTVTIPGRKVLESGRAIARSDDRILEVRTKNSPAGAQVTFIFSGKIPAYKVRLKGESVEFFVSSPEKS